MYYIYILVYIIPVCCNYIKRGTFYHVQIVAFSEIPNAPGSPFNDLMIQPVILHHPFPLVNHIIQYPLVNCPITTEHCTFIDIYSGFTH